MVVGICQLTFHLPGIRSLKGKRQIVRKLCERLRNRFQISVSEVGAQDRYQEARIGIALVSNEARVLHSLLDNILEAITQMQLAPLVDRQFEILHYNDDMAGDALSALEDELGGWNDDEPWDDEEAASASDPWAYMNSWTDSPGVASREDSEPSDPSPSSVKKGKR